MNLVARRARLSEREALFNLTSQGGTDTTFWLAEAPRNGWSWTLIAGAHTQPRRDLDEDGWTDLAGFTRVAVRPRLFYEDGRGTSVFVTGAFIGEDREGGTLDGGVAPDGRPFRKCSTPGGAISARSDAGCWARWC